MVFAEHAIAASNTSSQDGFNVAQTAVECIKPGALVVDVNITILACLQFFPCHKKFTV